MSRLVVLVLLLLTACADATDAAPIPPTATTVRVIQATLVSTVARNLQAIATPTADSTPPGLAECEANAAMPTALHTVDATIDYEAHHADVRQRIDYLNRTNETLVQLVLNVDPNRLPGAFQLNSLQPEGEIAAYELTGRRLTIDLREPLAPGCSIELDLDFALAIQ
jgi:hypothetical protein